MFGFHKDRSKAAAASDNNSGGGLFNLERKWSKKNKHNKHNNDEAETPNSTRSILTTTTAAVALDSEITLDDPSSLSFLPTTEDHSKIAALDAALDNAQKNPTIGNTTTHSNTSNTTHSNNTTNTLNSNNNTNNRHPRDDSESTIESIEFRNRFGNLRDSHALIRGPHRRSSGVSFASNTSQHTFASQNTFGSQYTTEDSQNTFANGSSNQTLNSSSGSFLSSSQQQAPPPKKGVHFQGVQERRYRMTLGEHPDTEGVPVQLSWQHENSQMFDSITQHEAQKVGLHVISEQTRSRIALRRHSTNTILNILEKMKQIRIGRKKTQQQVECEDYHQQHGGVKIAKPENEQDDDDDECNEEEEHALELEREQQKEFVRQQMQQRHAADDKHNHDGGQQQQQAQEHYQAQQQKPQQHRHNHPGSPPPRPRSPPQQAQPHSRPQSPSQSLLTREPSSLDSPVVDAPPRLRHHRVPTDCPL